MSNPSSSIPIAQAIQSLRHELSQAIADGKDEDLRFKLGPIELEFQVEVSWEGEAKGGASGGIKFGIVSLGEVSGEAGVSRSRGTTHTIKLTLHPEGPRGQIMKVSDSVAERPG
jgi:hypothetical protein